MTHEGTALHDDRLFPHDNAVQWQRGQSFAAMVPTPPSRILDIGAGRGYVLHALGERFPSAERSGIELDEGCRCHLRRLGVLVTDDMAQTDGYFDVITLAHVLEHAVDPVALLADVRARLASGGRVLIEVPYATLAESLWHPWIDRADEPHVSFFSPKTLAIAIERAGLAVLSCDTTGPLFRVDRPSTAASVAAVIRRILPAGLNRGLSRQRIADAQYDVRGGHRIWIRAVATH